MLDTAADNLHGVLLAAGASRRFGSPKALAKFGAQTLLERAISTAQAVLGDRFTVILGANAAVIRPALSLPDRQVASHDGWRAGLSSTLRFGLAQVPAASPAALIMLLDQPAVGVAELQSLIDAWRERPSIAAAAWYADDPGAPCILPRALFEAAATLQGDRGAKTLLQTLPQVSRVPMTVAAFDVDTPEDLLRAAGLVRLSH